ncbi:glycosyltransferase, partial [Streptomyces sp. NPDC059618]|uniref:glycosyltransferase n=1 Tax=Streptomyces sp. NPDC059618 TaxID=3346887 RepID=UPI00368582CF
CAFTHGVMQAWAGHRPGYYDLVHSHYWLSGHVGWLAAQRWGAPLVHAMHTMAKVKNANLADGDTPEPAARVIGETQIVSAADRLIANTAEEADELVRHYDAGRGKVAVVHPGVNLDRFTPADGRAAARSRIVVPVVGGPSGSGLAKPEGLQKLAARLDIADVVRFRPPVGQDQLADWFRAASLLVVPSYSESFGLVAIEAQAAGTPVLAASVGGLPVAVRDGETGFLVRGHDPAAYARVLERFADGPDLPARMGAAATAHAQSFGWDTAAAATADVYAAATQAHRRRVRSEHG